MSDVSDVSKEGGPAAHTLPPQPTEVDPLPLLVRDHLRTLRVILPVINVAVMALRQQDAALDDYIATVLREHACEPLGFEIEHLEGMLVSLSYLGRQQEVRL